MRHSDLKPTLTHPICKIFWTPIGILGLITLPVLVVVAVLLDQRENIINTIRDRSKQFIDLALYRVK